MVFVLGSFGVTGFLRALIFGLILQLSDGKSLRLDIFGFKAKLKQKKFIFK